MDIFNKIEQNVDYIKQIYPIIPLSESSKIAELQTSIYKISRDKK